MLHLIGNYYKYAYVVLHQQHTQSQKFRAMFLERSKLKATGVGLSKLINERHHDTTLVIGYLKLLSFEKLALGS